MKFSRITASSKLKECSAWQKVSKGAIERPRNPKKRNQDNCSDTEPKDRRMAANSRFQQKEIAAQRSMQQPARAQVIACAFGSFAKIPDRSALPGSSLCSHGERRRAQRKLDANYYRSIGSLYMRAKCHRQRTRLSRHRKHDRTAGLLRRGVSSEIGKATSR